MSREQLGYLLRLVKGGMLERATTIIEQELAKPEERVCCGDYEKCWKACTPRGRWLAEQELAKPEQASNEPPDYVEPPTSDYHNGWEEGFEAAKNLFKEKST
jgi:hypothetical protein